MFYPTRTILIAVCLVVLSSPFVGAQAKTKARKPVVKPDLQSVGKKSERFPNELTNYRFYESAKWKSLEPLVSTMADVRRIMGEPTEANDASQFTKPYPGDDKAKRPVFQYSKDPDWTVLIYFLKYCFSGYDYPLSSKLDDRLCSIDLIPKKPISFSNLVFPDLFKKTHVDAFHGRWDEYTDETGLRYQVYAGPSAYGHDKAGDLNRIVYTASDETFKKYSQQKNK